MGGTSTPIEHTDVDAIVEVTGGSSVTPTPTEVPTPTPTPGPVSDLDEAMNVAGGTLHFTTEGDYPWIVEEMLQEHQRQRCKFHLHGFHHGYRGCG